MQRFFRSVTNRKSEWINLVISIRCHCYQQLPLVLAIEVRCIDAYHRPAIPEPFNTQTQSPKGTVKCTSSRHTTVVALQLCHRGWICIFYCRQEPRQFYAWLIEIPVDGCNHFLFCIPNLIVRRPMAVLHMQKTTQGCYYSWNVFPYVWPKCDGNELRTHHPSIMIHLEWRASVGTLTCCDHPQLGPFAIDSSNWPQTCIVYTRYNQSPGVWLHVLKFLIEPNREHG